MISTTLYLLVTEMTLILADDSCPGLPLCFCNKDKTSIKCEGKGFTSIPDNIPNSVEKLYLGYNQIKSIDTMAFSSLPNLQQLYLPNNEISEIQPYAFGNCSSLVMLDVRENSLISIGKNAFSNMTGLVSLNLLTNRIQSIDETAFIGTESLTKIYLQSNSLTAIPNIGYLPNLQKLVLESNGMTNATFPDSFNTAKKPMHIVLSNNNIKSLGNNTFEALRNKSISSLYLSHNRLTDIDSGTFSPLGSITSLKLGSNPLHSKALRTATEGLKGKDITFFDISWIKLNVRFEHRPTFELLRNTSITALKMRKNKIQTLPDRFFSGLNQLLHLDLTSCEIQKTSSASFDGLDILTFLTLDKNKLISIPKKLPNTLVKLHLDDNQLTNVPNMAFSNLKFLQELRMRKNMIHSLQQDSFMGLKRLNNLFLNDNSIATLPGKVFDPLVHLLSLDLENNNLATVQNVKDPFSSLESLQYLNLAHNEISYLRPDFFKHTISLKYLHLEHNLLGDHQAHDFESALFKGLNNLEELYLMDNKLTTISDHVFLDLRSLKFLNLTNNQLSNWEANVFKATQNLQVLDLTKNLIEFLVKENVHDFTTNMKSLNLTGNPFLCNCDLRWFRDWMNRTSVELTNNASYQCHGPEEWAGKSLLSFNRTKINCVFTKWFSILIACAVEFIIAVIISGMVYRKRWWIKLFIYKQRHRVRKTRKLNAADGHRRYGAIEEANDAYDAYISYADEDKDWVLDYLLPGVDGGKFGDQKFDGQYSLYFADRNPEYGRADVGNIYEKMGRSRKMFLVLSKHYLQNTLHMFEFHLATGMKYKDDKLEIIVIDIGLGLPDKEASKSLMNAIQINELLEWRKDSDAQEHFRFEINDILAR